MSFNNEKPKMTPAVRTVGFTGDWEQRKFNWMLDPEDGIRRGPFGSALKKSLFVADSPYAVYEQQNAIYDRFNTRYCISEQTFNKLRKFELHSGDFIMSGAGTIGRISRVPEGIKAGVFNQALIRFRVDSKKVSPKYFLQLIRSPQMQKRLTESNPGSAITNLVPMSEVKNWLVSLPSKGEQMQISGFVTLIDKTITLHQRKLSGLQQARHWAEQNLLPEPNETAPKVRVGEFDGEWKRVPIGDVTSRVRGNDGRMDLPTLTISATNGWMNQQDRFSGNIAGKEQKNYTLLKRGQLSYNHGNSKAATYGVVFALKDLEEALVPRVYHSFEVNTGMDASYLECLFATRKPDQQLRKFVSSSARMDGLLNITYDSFAKVLIPVPSLAEQQAIAKVFTTIDARIKSEQQLIADLQEVKRWALNNMFI